MLRVVEWVNTLRLFCHGRKTANYVSPSELGGRVTPQTSARTARARKGTKRCCTAWESPHSTGTSTRSSQRPCATTSR
eukprot:scaffold69454_cov69-Phaeocystis_antarctica.AAC.1